ncbi:mis18-binding protein 1-like isoform X2 [Mercenaria mercenaria]|uniref:mis18-binding protein 1-like isoform X2 n=1 Tax=Mercenaria mercenaria TaxID=6596 RepID=UPI00234F1FA5|nr:mis18-binding protein 1-like isoform X2 [Mercenaria mercenaria]
MSMQNRNSRLFSQRAFDSNIEQLVRESPVPQMLFHGHHTDSSNNSFVLPCSSQGHPMSASAIPKLHGYATASPCARFEPFRSPQSLNSTFPSNTSYPSAADIFKSLKSQSRFERDNLLDTSHEKEHGHKENDPGMANNVSDRHFHTHSDRQPQVHEPASIMPEILTGIVGNSSHYDGYRHQVHSKKSGSSTGNKVDKTYEENFQEAFYDSGTNKEDERVSPEMIEACSLYMWIIKPVPGSHSICVEGKKSLADDNFWHSGVITHRINEKVVETQTRSVYRLEGNMELLDAMAAGFSRKTAEAFWLGFPSDWQKLIQEHFSTVPLNSIEEKQSDSEEEITTLEDGGEESDDTDTGQEDTTLTEVVSADEDGSLPSSGKVETQAVLHSPVDNKKGSRKGSKSEVVIENWIIKSLPNGKGVNVLGTKPESGLLWHSSAIEKRLDKKRLMSSSGSVYRLKGNMDKLLSLNEGLPVKIIDKFSSGFPKEWQELIQEFLYTKQTDKRKSDKAKQKKKNTSKKKGQVGDRKGKIQKDSAHLKKVTKKSEIPTQNIPSKVKEVISSQQKSTNSLKKSSERTRPKDGAEPAETYKRTKTVLTPKGEMVDLESLGRSRSGRLIKPPLQWWTGQTLELDGENVTVKAPTVASSMFLQEFEDGYKKSTRQVKPYWNPRQKDKDYSLNISKSSLNSSVSSVETKRKHKTQKEEQENTSSNTVDISSQSEDDLDPKLKFEVKLILEHVKGKRKKVQKRETCYSSKKKERESRAENDNPFDLNETTDLDTTETEQESSNQVVSNRSSSKGRGDRKNGKKTKIAPLKEVKTKVEQVNVVSSSTGDVGHDEEGIGYRALRSRKGKVSEPAGTNMALRLNKKETCVENKVNISRTRRVLSVIKEDEADDEIGLCDEDFEPMKKPKKKVNVITKRAALSRSKNSVKEGDGKVETVSKPPESSDDIEAHWTKDEKGRLDEACKNVSLSNPHYWERVAAQVRTKTADMCKAMYYSDQKLPKSAEKKSKKNIKEKVKVTSLTANVGTLKRKQQLKDLLEQQNENYSDDLFDSTPYRMTRKRKVPVLGGDDDDAIFEELARKQGKTRFETPVATETMCSRITVPFASTKKTPVSNLTVEMQDGSGDADGYVHKILKRRLLAKGKKKFGTPKPVKKIPNVEISPQQKLLFHNYLQEKKEKAENHQDSDQEEDFYWEDDVEN